MFLSNIVKETVTTYHDYYSKRYFEGKRYNPSDMHYHVLGSISAEKADNLELIISSEIKEMQLPVTRALIKNYVKTYDKSKLKDSKVYNIPDDVYLRIITKFIGDKNSPIFKYITKNDFLDVSLITQDIISKLKLSTKLNKAIVKKSNTHIEKFLLDEFDKITSEYTYSTTQPIHRDYHISTKYHLNNVKYLKSFHDAYLRGEIDEQILCNLDTLQLYNGTSIDRIKVTFTNCTDGYPFLELYPSAILLHYDADTLPFVQKIDDNIVDVKNVFTKLSYYIKNNKSLNIGISELKILWKYIQNIYDEKIVTPKWV